MNIIRPTSGDAVSSIASIKIMRAMIPPLAILIAAICVAAPATSSAQPTVQSLAATNITPTSAILKASINPNGMSVSVSFQYGATTNYGTTTFAAPLGAGVVPVIFSHTLTGLAPGSTNHYRIVASSAAGGVNGADVAFVASEFNPTPIALPRVGRGAVIWGDFDSDGKLDILLTGEDASFNNVSQLWRNTGGNVFSNVNASIPALSSSAAAWGDLFNDGKQDLVISGFAGTDVNHFPILETQVLRNNGSGVFTQVATSLPGVDTGSIALEDYDNDGRVDILLTGFAGSGAITQIWRNLGNGVFGNINAPLPAVFYSSVAWADYDGDGNPDFVLAGTTNGFVSDSICQVWHNSGNGTFANINAGLPGVSQGAVAWGDFDNDGKPDLLITGYSATGPIAQVWRNLGNGKFSNWNVPLTGVSQSAVAVGDFDNDGKLDFAITGMDVNTNFITQVWRNLGNGGFSNVPTGINGLALGTVAWVDTDNDGRLDLLLSGFDATNNPVLSLYRNNTALTNTNVLRIANLSKLTNGFSRVTFDAAAGYSYRVQASADLKNWTAVGASATSSPGVQQFNEVGVTNRTRFYRVTTP